jgi:hypothetical protein
MKLPRFNWRLGRSAVLICIDGVWAWKLAEFAYQESKKRDPLGQTPWGLRHQLRPASVRYHYCWAGVGRSETRPTVQGQTIEALSVVPVRKGQAQIFVFSHAENLLCAERDGKIEPCSSTN